MNKSLFTAIIKSAGNARSCGRVPVAAVNKQVIMQWRVKPNANLIGKYYISFSARGKKRYEFADQRGSVLLTTSDKKIPYSSNGTPVLAQASRLCQS